MGADAHPFSRLREKESATGRQLAVVPAYAGRKAGGAFAATQPLSQRTVVRKVGPTFITQGIEISASAAKKTSPKIVPSRQ